MHGSSAFLEKFPENSDDINKAQFILNYNHWQNGREYRFMWLTIVLSFGFYIPVVLWADQYPVIGFLMMPKTCAYVWTVLIGYRSMKKALAGRS